MILHNTGVLISVLLFCMLNCFIRSTTVLKKSIFQITKDEYLKHMNNTNFITQVMLITVTELYIYVVMKIVVYLHGETLRPLYMLLQGIEPAP